MIKWAFKAFKAFRLFTGQSFVNHWMKLLLFPSMAESTHLQAFTTFFITSNKCPTLPVFAKLGIISEKIRPPPKILKVMRVNTLRFVMVMIVRAPFSFEEKNIKIYILICW
jgi:hypothetical protein